MLDCPQHDQILIVDHNGKILRFQLVIKIHRGNAKIADLLQRFLVRCSKQNSVGRVAFKTVRRRLGQPPLPKREQPRAMSAGVFADATEHLPAKHSRRFNQQFDMQRFGQLDDSPCSDETCGELALVVNESRRPVAMASPYCIVILGRFHLCNRISGKSRQAAERF